MDDLNLTKYFSPRSYVQPNVCYQLLINLILHWLKVILTCCNRMTSAFLSILIAQKDPVP
jgi:hypothetical protein